MLRITSPARIDAGPRLNAEGKKSLGFLNDGKLHVILDTNIIIYGIQGLIKNEPADSREKDCKYILESLRSGLFSIGINHYLVSEYSQIKNKYNELKWIFDLLNTASPFRVLVDRQRISRSPKDDFLFDGLSADYLVSENSKHVSAPRLKTKSPYKSIVTPAEFSRILKNP